MIPRLLRRTPALVVLLALSATAARSQVDGPRNPAVTTPESFLGFEIGADYHLATYTQLVEYWGRLARESDRMVLDTIGETEEGRPQVMAVLTSPDNHRNLDRYRAISRRMALARDVDEAEARTLAEQGKAVVWIDGGLHASEVLGAQQLMQLVYDMVSLEDAETRRFLDDVILLAVHANPDGHELLSTWYMREPDPLKRTTSGTPVLYEKYAGHDNNRDFYMANLAETQNMNRVAYTEWFPQILYNHHQTGPEGTIMFSPPFRDPPNYNIHPLVLTMLEQVGGQMHARFAREGKGGVTTRSGASYSTWWNGGLRTTPYFKNMIGLLTETVGHPTPIQIPFIPSRQLEEHDLPLPVEPGLWHFKQSIDYSQTANRGVLDFASRSREHMLLNIWTMGRDAIARGDRDSWDNTPDEIEAAQQVIERRGSREDFDRLLRKPEDREPRGYILPADQPDFNTALRFVNTLLMNGVEVHRATRAFSVAGTSYPEGSLVVRTNQAFAPHVIDMFEPQVHPNDFAYPGGPPIPPYDLTGWTLAFQMDVEFDRVLEDFDGPFQAVSAWNLDPAPGRVAGAGDAAGYLLDHRVNDAFRVVNRVLKRGGEVYWLDQEVTAEGTTFPPGAFYVTGAGVDRAGMEALARETGVDAVGVARRPAGPSRKLRPVRIGLWDQYGGSMTSGWTRFVLEQFEFDYELVFPPDLDRGNLKASYDVLVFPDGAIPVGEPRGGDMSADFLRTIPAEYRGRVGRTTVDKSVPGIVEFVRAGGSAVAVGGSTALGRHAGLPLGSHLVGEDGGPLANEQFFVPGSLLRVELEHGSPLLHGMGESADVMFARSPVLRVEGAPTGVQVVGRYGERPLRSGWAWGQERLRGGAAFVEATLGQGKLFLFTPEITFRGQSHGTFPLLFNAIYYGTAQEVGTATEEGRAR